MDLYRNRGRIANGGGAPAANGGGQQRNLNILVGVSATPAAAQIQMICVGLGNYANVRVICGTHSDSFFDKPLLGRTYSVFTNGDERIGLVDDLVQWAHVLLIAPASVDTISKISNGMADDLLSRITRSWDSYNKRMFFAPDMSANMWFNVVTENQVGELEDRRLLLINPDQGRMAAVPQILTFMFNTLRLG